MTTTTAAALTAATITTVAATVPALRHMMASSDSRLWGLVPAANVLAKVVRKL